MAKNDKIAESLANGRFSVTPNIFDDDWDFINSLFSTQDTIEWYMMKLALAEYHCKEVMKMMPLKYTKVFLMT